MVKKDGLSLKTGLFYDFFIFISSVGWVKRSNPTKKIKGCWG